MSCIVGPGNMKEAYWSDTITNTLSLGLLGGALSTASVMLRDLAKNRVDEKWVLSLFVKAEPIVDAQKTAYVATRALASAVGGGLMSTLNWNACSTAYPLASIGFESATVGLQTACLGALFLMSLKGTVNQADWVYLFRTPPGENPHVRATMIKIVSLIAAAVAVANAVERVTSLFGFPVC